jgi:hypothetical protein
VNVYDDENKLGSFISAGGLLGYARHNIQIAMGYLLANVCGMFRYGSACAVERG